MNLKSLKKHASTKYKRIKKASAQRAFAAENVAAQQPVLVLVGVLALLLALIAVSAWLREPQVQEETLDVRVTQVVPYTIGETPRIEALAQVQKTGVIQIVAQSPGVVRNVRVDAGQEVGSGQVLVTLASNYFGGNAPALQRQIAQKQYENTKETLDTQKEAIQKQRALAETQEENSEELRDIQQDSLEDTEQLLELNEELLESVDLALQSATTSAEIQQTKQLKAQLLSSVVQLRSQLRQTEYQADDDNPPAELARLQRDLTLKQLRVQEQSLDLQLEISELQYKLARVQEASMYPAAPFAGQVERIHVREGQYVQPGQVLVTLDCDALATQLVVPVSNQLARSISTLNPTVVLLGDTSVELFPDYVSQEATYGQLYSVLYTVPQDADVSGITDGGTITVSLPVGQADTGSTLPFIPIDAVHQNEQTSQVYIVGPDSTVKAQTVELGQVQGRYVEVLSGLESGVQVIVNRAVVPGEKIEINQ